MSTPLKFHSLTTAAANWIVKHNRDYDSLASWDASSDGWPPTTAGDPIYVAILPTGFLGAKHMSAQDLAVAMRRRFDPGESSDWVFVPDVTEDGVWIVHTKRVPTALN